jgi:exodeoxyribonuclease III
MKIISWKVNGIRAVEKKGFADWLLSSGADVVCIQETKANPSQLSPALLFPGSADGYQIVLCGDYNIAHTPIDLANPKSNEGNAGYLPEERAWMDMFTQNGYVDTFRQFCKEPKQYTWWSYRFHAREKNIGWRIDYQCVNTALAGKVKSSIILSDVMGSDHCPIQLELED